MIRFNDQLDSIEDQDERLKISRFITSFRENFHSNPAYVIRAPGRINLIGDHIDYHGFSVLPMAIKSSILLACSFTPKQQHQQQQQMATPNKLADDNCTNSRSNNVIRIQNNNSTLYEHFVGRHSFSYGSQLDKCHKWFHYVLCGYHGVLANELLHIKASQVFVHAKQIVQQSHTTYNCNHAQAIDIEQDSVLGNQLASGLNIFVDSDLPPASGLSSSSALVCASALATHLFLLNNNNNNQGEQQQQPPHQQKLANDGGLESGEVLTTMHNDKDIMIDSKSIAENCSKFEHLIGTHGGGMDQAVIMTAQDGYAKHVEFVPNFSCTNVRLPDNVVWLVSHCGSSYPKAATSGFNSRVLETKLAAALIVKHFHPNPCDKFSLDHTLTLGQVKSELFSQESAAEIVTTLVREKVFFNDENKGLSLDEICSRLEMSRAELIERFKTSEEFLINSKLSEQVCLLKRCEHVFEEAERVVQFKLICDTTKDIRRLGKLMSDSHNSLRDKYECSHPDLNKLVDISLEAGSLGARLTGAGWGGCIVSLVESNKCDTVLAALKKVSKFTFQTEPKSGCTVIRV